MNDKSYLELILGHNRQLLSVYGTLRKQRMLVLNPEPY